MITAIATTSHASRRPPRRGVSLVEVLATLVLVGIVLPAAMQGVTLSLRAAQVARHQQEATMLAEARLGEIHAARDASMFTGAGDFGIEWPEYRWECQSMPAEFGLSEVTVTVYWQERGLERSVALTSLVYTPLTSDPLGGSGMGGGIAP